MTESRKQKVRVKLAAKCPGFDRRAADATHDAAHVTSCPACHELLPASTPFRVIRHSAGAVFLCPRCFWPIRAVAR